MSDQIHEVFKILSGFSVEPTDNFLLIKIGIDDLIKKILALSHMHELGVEYVVDGKYVIFKVPVLGLGEEALKKIGMQQRSP